MSSAKRFFRQFENFQRTYRRKVDFSKEYARYLPGDLIEIYDDFKHVAPILRQFVNCKVPPKDFWSAMSKIECRLWHLIKHMSDLQTTLDRLLDDDLNASVKKRTKPRFKATKNRTSDSRQKRAAGEASPLSRKGPPHSRGG